MIKREREAQKEIFSVVFYAKRLNRNSAKTYKIVLNDSLIDKISFYASFFPNFLSLLDY